MEKSPLLTAAITGHSEDRKKREVEMDNRMKEHFCPIVDGDCRGIRCMLATDLPAGFYSCGIEKFIINIPMMIYDLNLTISRVKED